MDTAPNDSNGWIADLRAANNKVAPNAIIGRSTPKRRVQMVAPRNRTQKVKQLVARLVRESRDKVDALPTVHRPFHRLAQRPRVQVKHIVEAVARTSETSS